MNFHTYESHEWCRPEFFLRIRNNFNLSREKISTYILISFSMAISNKNCTWYNPSCDWYCCGRWPNRSCKLLLNLSSEVTIYGSCNCCWGLVDSPGILMEELFTRAWWLWSHRRESVGRFVEHRNTNSDPGRTTRHVGLDSNTRPMSGKLKIETRILISKACCTLAQIRPEPTRQNRTEPMRYAHT